MSKNMTRKGLAFGAIVALGSTLFAGLPAQANNEGPITLLPNGGTATGATTTSIIGAGITMTATMNPALVAAANNTTFESNMVYVVTNTAGAKITLDLPNTAQGGFLVYNADGNTSANGTTASQTYATSTLGALTDALYVIYDGTEKSLVTNATKIVVRAGIDNGASDKDTFGALKIDAESTTSVSVSVQAISDTDTAGTGTTGKVGPFENKSASATVNLLPVSSVSATTSIVTLDRSASGEFVARTTYGSSVNPHAVSANSFVQLFKDGTVVNLDENSTAAGANIAYQTGSSVSSGRVVFTGWNDDGSAAVAFGAGIYSAQAYFKANGSSTYVRVGSASPVVDLNNGLVANINTTDAFATANANLAFSSNAATVRTGTKTVEISAKTLTSGSADIVSSGIRYRAVVTAVKLSATSATSVSGSASSLAATDDVVTAFATSDSTGQVKFTLTNAVGARTDQITVAVSALKSDGTYTAADTVTITWANAALTTFSASPGNYISGANPTLTFRAKDQFGQPITSTANGALSVTVVAKIGGVEDKTKLSDTKTMTNGAVSFTFANFATTAIPAQVEAVLFEGRTQSSVGSSGTVTVNVYNTLATDRITVLDSYKTNITYVDYVTGDETDSAVAEKLALTGLASAASATITGSVQNANAVGQPGAEVVVSADGILFYDAAEGMYVKDKITIYTNEFGTYSVKAFAQRVNTSGHTVTLASGGKTATTKLRTYFPVDLLTANNLNLTWDLPATLVKNTTYALTATLTDKWGNPVATTGAGSIDFQGTGSVEVNGVATTVSRNFDSNGKALVFIRSVKDIAGPGSITASLKAVASQYAVDPAVTGDTLGFDQFGSLSTVTTDVRSTAWDETKFRSTLTAVVDIKDVAPASAGEVAIGSFNGRVAVRVEGLQGSRLSVKVGTRWYVVASVPTNRYVWSIPSRRGAVAKVSAYINGDLENTQTITVR